MIENWLTFEKGTYNTLTERPALNYRTFLNEDIVRDNLPELTLEERVLVQMKTLEIPADRQGQYLIDNKVQEGEFKMLDAEKKKSDRKMGVTAKGTKPP